MKPARNRGRKRKGPSAPSPRKVASPTKVKINGSVLVEAFKHIKESVPILEDKWFSADDWLNILPKYWGILKGKEEEYSTKMFTRAMNKIAQNSLHSSSATGVYINYYGCSRTQYYLFTTAERCPDIPKGQTFRISNIHDFVDDIPSTTNSSSTTTTNNNNNNNNNNDKRKKSSDIIREETRFSCRSVFNTLMPEGCDFDAYDDPAKAIREWLHQTKRMCEIGMIHWQEAVEGDGVASDVSSYCQTNIIMKCTYVRNAIDKALDENTTWTDCCKHAVNEVTRMGFKYIESERTVMRWYNQLQKTAEGRFPHPDPQIAAGEVALPPFFVEFPDALQAFYNHADALADKDELSCEAMQDYVNYKLIPYLVNKHNKGLPVEEKISKYNFLLGLNFLRRTRHDDDDDDEEDEEIEDPTICKKTVNKWMTKLGYGWKRRERTSYNSTHEHPVTIAYRASFILRYFYKYEPRAHRWVQVEKVDADLLKKNSNVPNDAGIEYKTANGNEMVEFHVDDCQSFGMIMDRDTEFGGQLSVLFLNMKTCLLEDEATKKLLETEVGNYKYEKDGESWTEIHASQFKHPNSEEVKQFIDKNELSYDGSVRVPLIMWGQDECIFKQYITFMHHWVKRDGQRPMTPKDDGMGMMVSSIKSREFGFGFELTTEQLEKVNAFRRTRRPRYRDEKAATETNGTPLKSPLDKAAFLVLFDYGTNAEGYWSYNKMVLQLEDCIDTLDALYSIPTAEVEDEARKQHMPDVPGVQGLKRVYDYVFLFDHSCGHDRKQENGLTTKDIRVSPTAKGRHMRDSKIEKKSGYLGDYEGTLKVGDVQQMVFGEVDTFGNPETGPIQGGMPKHDVIEGQKEEKLNAKELSAALLARGFNSKGRRADLAKRCQSAGIAITRTVANVTKQGWLGKAKGSLHILYERGMVDKNNLSQYSQKGKTDDLGNCNKETSLDYLMDQLEDFANERTMLQMIGEELGCIIDRTPKCTPEIAGEGVEYDWAMAKMFYRKQRITRKRTKESFVALVKESMGPNVLSRDRTRKFSRRARQYMISYYKLENDGKATTPLDIKKYKKKRKSHTDILKEDTGYISECLQQLVAANSINA